MLSVDFSASCAGPVTVRSLVVHHGGLGAAADFSSVYAVDVLTRITRGVTLQGSHPAAMLRFRNFVVPACSTRSIKIVADVSPHAAAGSLHRLSVTSAQDVSTDASVKLLHGKPSQAARTAPANEGLVTVQFLPLPDDNVLFGSDRIISRFSLTATDTDQSIAAITFTNDGSARDSDLQRLFLSGSSSEPLTSVQPILSGDTVRLSFSSPLLIERNATRIFLLHADVRASKRRTIRMTIQEPSDVEATRAR